MRYRFILATWLFVLPIVIASTGCERSELSSVEMSRLDSMDATAVVRAYFESGDPAVELYLSTPRERSLRAAPNYVPERERAAGVDNLNITGGGPAGREIEGAGGYGDVRQFVVEYDSRRASSIGEPPGRRSFFVYTGTDPETGNVRVLSVGTGP